MFLSNRYLLVVFLLLGLFVLSCSGDEDVLPEDTVTCTDSLQNGTETGVDCGGNCDPCISCTDGIQNGDETGVDCGGACGGLCGPPDTGFYFYGLIDGEEVLVTGTNGSGAGGCSLGQDTEYENGGAWSSDPINSDFFDGAVFLLEEAIMEIYDEDDFYAMFEEGIYTYGDCDDHIDGAKIYWLDDAGEQWSTDYTNQDGTEFEITNRGPKNGFSTIVEGTFKCKLTNGSEVKVMESGKFRMQAFLF